MSRFIWTLLHLFLWGGLLGFTISGTLLWKKVSSLSASHPAPSSTKDLPVKSLSIVAAAAQNTGLRLEPLSPSPPPLRAFLPLEFNRERLGPKLSDLLDQPHPDSGALLTALAEKYEGLGAYSSQVSPDEFYDQVQELLNVSEALANQNAFVDYRPVIQNHLMRALEVPEAYTGSHPKSEPTLNRLGGLVQRLTPDPERRKTILQELSSGFSAPEARSRLQTALGL